MVQMRCKRCGANEDRIHGFCSIECENYYEFESRIVELERDKKALRGIEENLREHIDIGTLQLSVATARIAELKAYIDQLIEIGSWAITGMTITTSYSPGVLQDLAEKKSDDWYALIKNLEECDKENEREE